MGGGPNRQGYNKGKPTGFWGDYSEGFENALKRESRKSPPTKSLAHCLKADIGHWNKNIISVLQIAPQVT